MTTPNDPMLSRIKKLLAKAEAKGCTEQERDALNAKATELMLKHAIDSAMLSGDDRPTEQITQKYISLHFLPGVYRYEYAVLAGFIAPYMNCKSFHIKLSRNHIIVVLVGFESDLESMESIYRSLITQCISSMHGWMSQFETKKEMFGFTPQQKMEAKKSYVIGFADGTRNKFRSIRQEFVTQTGNGAELVLVDRKKKVDNWINENISVRKARSRSYAEHGQLAGFLAGVQADIGQTQVSDDPASRGEIGR